MIKTLLKTLIFVVALGYLIFAVVKISRPADDMVCTGVEYQFTDTASNHLIDASVMNQLLGQHKISLKGKRIGDIDIKSLEDTLSEAPYIDTVMCYHTASGKLCIRITPQHPILHVFDKNGEEFYVGENGTIMAVFGLCADLPVVTGNVTRKYARTKLLHLGKFLTSDPYWCRQAQQVNIDAKGNVEIIPRVADQKILIGEPKDIEEKLGRVRLFYKNALPKAGWNKYKVINAIYDNQIICTRKK